MKYNYKILDLQTYISSIYKDGLGESFTYTDEEIKSYILNIGLFKFKGYIKAFRNDLSNYSIDDILFLYDFDRNLSANTFKLISNIEIKIKTYLIESVYGLTDNPFCYLLKDNYTDSFKLSNDSLHDWEVKKNRSKKELYPHYRDYYLGKYNFEDNCEEYLKNQELIELNEKKDINYPPFHYFIESATLGTVIHLLSKLMIQDISILKIVGKKFGVFKPEVFISYLLRVKELRNRCAHNSRIFNRNYRSVKAIGKYKSIRKKIYDHRLLDVYYTLYFLLDEETELQNSNDLENRFIVENFKSENQKMKEFILNCMRKR